MKRARCQDCGKTFLREIDETWKVRCITCFKKSKRAESEPIDSHWKDRAAAAESLAATLQSKVAHLEITVSNLIGQSLRQPPPSRIDRELAEHWRSLVQLVHPDKHGNSQAATIATQWLLSVRGRLQ